MEAKRRFITIVGAAGIGKSTLVRELVRYVQFRNIFKDGVVYT
jgi:ABC-type cobalamin/Fe3+-siderophores transport system ATPase subunit